MRGVNRLVVAVMLFVTGVPGFGSAAALAGNATTTATARGVVEGALADAVTTLRDESLRKPDRARKVGQILETNFDFETFSRLAVGQASWRQATPDQRSAFVDEFSKHVLAICRGGTYQYGGQDLKVAQDRAEARGDWTVQTRVIGKKNGSPREVATIDFRLRKRGQQWKVIDVTVSGISMAATFRAQFAALLRDGGIERAIQILREKNAAAADETVANGGEK